MLVESSLPFSSAVWDVMNLRGLRENAGSYKSFNFGKYCTSTACKRFNYFLVCPVMLLDLWLKHFLPALLFTKILFILRTLYTENPGDSRSDELHLSSVFVFTCHYMLNNSQSVAVECKRVGQTADKRVKWRRPLVFIADQTENWRHSSCSE